MAYINRMQLQLIFALAFLLAVPFTFGQVRVTGEIVGTVVDPSGAVVPGATVTALDIATTITTTVTCSGDGGFVVPNLQPGTYRVTVTAKGFATAVYEGIIVAVDRTTNLTATLRVGPTTQTVEVSGVATVVETTATTVATTILSKEVTDLPVSGRDIMPFALLTPGATYSGDPRYSTFNGLPSAAMNITLDGVVDNTMRFRSGDSGFYGFIPATLGAVEEMTTSTTGLTADAGAEGSMQIRFVTKRGTNTFHGSTFEQARNDVLNANNWFNDAVSAPKPKLRYNVFGGNLGGPFVKDRLFFFVNYEEQRSPTGATYFDTVLTPQAASGVFTYQGTDGQQHAVNLLTIAGQNGFPGTINPIIGGQLATIAGTEGNSILTPLNLYQNIDEFGYKESHVTRYPTARLDWVINKKLTWHGMWNLRWEKDGGVPQFAGLYPINNGFLGTYYIASNALDWSISPNMLNVFTVGVQGNHETFYPGNNIGNTYGTQGDVRIINDIGLTPLIPNQWVMPNVRNNPVYNYTDNLTWVRGKHSFIFGGSFRRSPMYEGYFDAEYGGGGVPAFTLDVSPGDPITGVLSPTNMPAISGADQSVAWSLYSFLTGRIANAYGATFVSGTTHQYTPFIPLVYREEQSVGSMYFQDSWRLNPRLTLNYGFRWEFSGADHNTNDTYTAPTLADLVGPSASEFNPGVLNGVLNPQIYLRPVQYTGDYVEPGPNVGFAWNPHFEQGLLSKIAGHDKTVVRGGFSITYYDEGMLLYQNIAGNNVGTTQWTSLIPGMPGFSPGGLSLGSTLPPLVGWPTSFTFPQPMADAPWGEWYGTVDPNIRSPYVQNWSFGIQREITKNSAFEVRYVGNRGNHLWRRYSLAEVNIFENGFLQEFQNAQKNLAINTAAGVVGFANNGLPGQVPLPILQAAFGATGGQGALPPSAGFQNGSFILNLQQGQAGAFASSLAGSPTYLCRLTGTNLPPCGPMGFSGPGTYPINFFQANPYITGGDAQVLSDPSWSNYNGLQMQYRMRASHGLTLTANYTYSNSLTDRYSNSTNMAVNYTTLRNPYFNKGPGEFNLPHTFQTFLTYDLPFGANRAYKTNNRLIDNVIGGWTASTIVRVQSGEEFELTSGYETYNQNDSGVVLTPGTTVSQLQSMIQPQGTSSGVIQVFSQRLIGPDGRSNPSYLTVPTTPGQLGQFVYLHGPHFWNTDIAVAKQIPITERVKLTFNCELLNAFNHPDFLVGSSDPSDVTMSIQSTSFGQTTTLAQSPRNIQLRALISF
jgi:hypothetical protein